jgi:hypothetical protein
MKFLHPPNKNPLDHSYGRLSTQGQGLISRQAVAAASPLAAAMVNRMRIKNDLRIRERNIHAPGGFYIVEFSRKYASITVTVWLLRRGGEVVRSKPDLHPHTERGKP